MSKKKVGALFLALLLPLVFLACSSGGGGGGGGGDTGTPTTSNASALTVADKVSVVDAKLSGSVAAAKPLRIGMFKLAPPADSDYNKDQTQVWVHERSVEGFNIINEILCMVAQTKYEEMLNAGAYIALVDMNQCSSKKGDTSQASEGSQDQSSGATMPDYEEWTVDVTRADNNSPQIFKGWIHEEGETGEGYSEPAKVITVKAVVTEGKSDTNPYGIFTINFAAYPVDPQTGLPGTQIMFKGYLESEKDSAGKILLKFVCEDTGGPNAEFSFKQAVTLDRGNDDTGKGTVYEKESHMEGGTPVTRENTFNIAYDPSFFLRTEPSGSTVCLDRVNFDESAWRYGLYDETTGARINRNSGFSINTAADGSGSHGWVGYWGVWIDERTTLSNDQTVYKFDYSTRTSTPYTIFTAGGKLKKHTKMNLTLGEVAGVPLDFWEWDPNTNQGSNFRVFWNGTVFNKTAQMSCTESGPCNWSNITPTPIDVTRLQWSELNFWSQSLGGQVRVPLPNCTWTDPDDIGPLPPRTVCDAPTNSTAVIFFKEDIVYPNNTVPASLLCYENCPKAGATGIDPMDSNYQMWDSMTGLNSEHTYTFNSTTMLLMDGANAVVSSTTSTINQWGYMSGALADANTPNLAALLDCNWDWDNNALTNPQTCGWKAWSALDVFYTWETGPNNWNQFTGLKDSGGTFLTFQPPLQVKYVHSQAGSPFNGATFLLEYAGFGNLHGIPGKCVNMDTGLEVDCSTGGPGQPVRWVPAFTIPTGAVVANGTANYLAKPLEMEQRMKKDETGGCSTLSPTAYPLPVIADWVDPAIGTEPVLTDPPAVIGGVVQ